MGQALRNGSELTLWTIEKLVPGGAGLCRLADGTIGFVDGAFPGETIEPLETLKKKDYTRATRYALVMASPERVPAICPVVDACGGCDWMKLERRAELSYKARLVVEAFERTGGLRLPAAPEVVTAGGELGYRSRVRLHVDERGRVGFYARGTHALVEIPGCPVAEPEVERGIALVRALAEEAPAAMARFEIVEVRARVEGGLEFMLHPRAEARQNRSPGAPGGADGPDIVERLRRHGSAIVSRSGAEFRQVNAAVNAVLVARIVEGALARNLRTFLDLYAGSGNFALPLAQAGLTGVAVERDARAVAEARARAERDAPDKLEFFARDVPSALRELARAKRRFDLVLLDPPRSGAKEALELLVALEPRAIAYVSCDPVTLARDVKALRQRAWELVSVTAFDMFPKTHHVETLAWLERGKAA